MLSHWHVCTLGGLRALSRARYAIDVPQWSFDWRTFVERRDAYIRRLSTNKERTFEREGVDLIRGRLHSSALTYEVVCVRRLLCSVCMGHVVLFRMSCVSLSSSLGPCVGVSE
jgi:hypothetical protein